MLKKTITYLDYDENERTEDFYFNLTNAELMELQLGTSGGLESMLKQIISAQDVPKIVEIFKKIILMSYGEKSLDGKRFIKNKELTDAFTQTEAYSQLFMELSTDSEKAAAFINAVIPKSIADKIKENPKAIEAAVVNN